MLKIIHILETNLQINKTGRKYYLCVIKSKLIKTLAIAYTSHGVLKDIWPML